MKKIGIVSFMHESNTFSSGLTSMESFQLLHGQDIVDEWHDAHQEIGGMLATIPELGLQPVPLLTAWAMPSGKLREDTFENILAQILQRIAGEALEALDGLLLSLHGAMVAEHFPDADGRIAEEIRRLVGPSLPCVMTLDLHANISEKMISNVSATTVYRTYPHLDQRERGDEAVLLLADLLEGKTEPVQCLIKPPLVIPILAQRTDRRPAAALYQAREKAASRPGILSASIALGFPYADVEELGTSILVVADRDASLSQDVAMELASVVWQMRDQLNLQGIPVESAARIASEFEEGPLTLLDVGDNVGGGSPGDGTHLLDALLKKGVRNLLVILYDPEAVKKCIKEGVGNMIFLQVGGKSDSLHGAPLLVRGKVRLIHDGLFYEREARHGGKFLNDQGVTAVVETAEENTIVLTSRRMAPFSLEQILSLGIRPKQKGVLIVKGAVAPRAAYECVSKEVIEVDSPGVSSANPLRFNYMHRRRPLYPFEADCAFPVDFHRLRKRAPSF